MKYKIVSLPNTDEVCFYGANIGDIIEIDDRDRSAGVWCFGSYVFKEDGWIGLDTYCVADEMKSFLEFVEEVV